MCVSQLKPFTLPLFPRPVDLIVHLLLMFLSGVIVIPTPKCWYYILEEVSESQSEAQGLFGAHIPETKEEGITYFTPSCSCSSSPSCSSTSCSSSSSSSPSSTSSSSCSSCCCSYSSSPFSPSSSSSSSSSFSSSTSLFSSFFPHAPCAPALSLPLPPLLPLFLSAIVR